MEENSKKSQQRMEKREYEIVVVLQVFALMVGVIAVAINLFTNPVSLDTLDAVTLCVAIYWYLTISVAEPDIEHSLGRASVLLAIIIALQIYVSLGIALVLYVAVGALSILVVIDIRNRISALKLGYVACKDVLTGHAHIA